MKIVLFDMDGTLTEPRKNISKEMLKALEDLSNHTDIGIVTGSDFDYVDQQCSELLRSKTLSSKLHIFPCNGTKRYTREEGEFVISYSADMIDAIGQADYNYLVQSLIPHQLMISLNHELPYTGTFFHYRGSMLNWCPIGRQSGDFARKAWVKADTESGIRSYYMKQIQNIISSREIQASVALGGSTSFDIYPLGWNKTYVLKHLSDYSSIYFVGDRCEEGGNDWHIYNKLKDISDRDTGSFATSSMSDTMKIIQTLISKLS